jgi:pimeloyl-ACP methyl ester carboxylesterase
MRGMQTVEALRGLRDLVLDAVAGGATRVEEMHTAIARRPFGALALAPGVPAVRGTHDTIAALAYAAVRSTVGVIAAASDAVLDALPGSEGGTAPRLSPSLELARGALNGVIGDRLERTRNGLRFALEFRHDGRPLALDRASLARTHPRASRRLAVFLHGLAGCELTWRFYSARHYGNPDTTYGSLLERDLGYSPLYLRYNTGLHVSENGTLLARELEELVRGWPVPVEEIALVGHSMGGLVARSACHYGRAAGAGWVDRVRHVVGLGAPHLGAPLEKLGNVLGWVLSSSDITRPLATVLNGRSAGIKDMRFGSLLEEDWKTCDPDALLQDRCQGVPFLDTATYYFVAAALTRDPGHPLGWVLGDTLVRLQSATGHARNPLRVVPFRDEHGHRVGGMYHLELVNHPLVYAQLRAWLGRA